MQRAVITKCDSFSITKRDKCYCKVRQVLQSVTILLQSATIATKCDRTRVKGVQNFSFCELSMQIL